MLTTRKPRWLGLGASPRWHWPRHPSWPPRRSRALLVAGMKPRIIPEERFVEQMEEGMRTHGLIARNALQVYARRVASPLPTQEALVYADHMARLQLALNQLKAKP